MRDSYFVPPTVKPGESISWGTLHPTDDITMHEWIDGHLVRVHYVGVPFTPLPYCTFGDYDNSTATERSNLRVMRERFSWLVHVTGDYGSQMLGYLGKRENQNPDLIEAIEELERYPIADESDESELEMTMEWEGWCDWGRRDFAQDLSDALDEINPTREHLDWRDLIPRDDDDPERPHTERNAFTLAIDEVWHKGSDAFGVNGGTGMVIESGGNVHFYIDEWCERAVREPKDHVYGDKVYRSEHEVRAMLLEISRTYGTIKPNTDHALDHSVKRVLVAISLGWSGVEAPRDLIKLCRDDDSCSVLGDWIDEHTPSVVPSPQTEMLL